MKIIYGPGFVMLDTSSALTRADFWILQNRHGVYLNSQRNELAKTFRKRQFKLFRKAA